MDLKDLDYEVLERASMPGLSHRQHSPLFERYIARGGTCTNFFLASDGGLRWSAYITLGPLPPSSTLAMT